jgi:hypothetical protein
MAGTCLRWTILRRLFISTEIQMASQSVLSQCETSFCWRNKAMVVACLLGAAGAIHAQNIKALTLRDPQPFLDVVFSPRMDIIAVHQRERDQEIQLLEFPSLRRYGELGRSLVPGATRFSPCGKYVVVNADLEKDGSLSLWDVAVRPSKKLKVLWQKKDDVDILEDRIFGYPMFSPDGKRIRVIAGRHLLQWDWQDSHIAKERWPLPGGELGCFLFSYDNILRLRGNRFKRTPGQIVRFDGKNFIKATELDPQIWGEADGCFTADLKTVVWPDQPDQNVRFADQKRRDILVMDLEKPGCKVVDRITGDWLDKEEKTGKLCHGPICSVIPDRSLVIVYYGLTSGIPPVEHQGFGFFPRTKEKMAEFGLDPKTQTHLYLPVPKRVAVPPRVVLSPDGRWLALTEVDLPPRIWPVETLGKALLADKSVLKK